MPGHHHEQTMLWLYDIRLPAVGSGVRKARGLIDALDVAITSECRDDLRLLISEVMTNAIRHGGPADPSPGAEVRVRVGHHGPRLRVEVHDEGEGFEHAPRGPMSQLDSGWGVHFVDQLADDWGTGRSDDHWVVWFEVTLPRRPARTEAMTYGQRAGDVAPVTTERDEGGASDLARVG